MIAPHDPAECARLIAEALERSTLITADIPECTCAGWPHHLTCLQEGHLEKLNLAHAWLRNNLRAMADQLEAALVERSWFESANHALGMLVKELTEERDRMRPVVEAAERLRDGSPLASIGQLTIDLDAAVDAYRAARDKAGA